MAGFDQWLMSGLGTVAGHALPVWMAGALAALLFFIGVIAFARAAQIGRVGAVWRVALVLVGAGVVAMLAGSLGNRDHSAARRALDARAAELTLRVIAPGSPLACLESVANDTVEAACEKLLFASPETIAAGMAYTEARLLLLSDGVDLAARDPGYGPSIERLRRVIEEDRFGMVAQVLVTRGCTADNCAAFRLLRDPRRVTANIRERKFDASVVLNAPVWRNEGAASAPVAAAPSVPTVASVPHVATTGAAPTVRFEYPSAASIPAISIMNAEPPLPPGEAAAAAPPAQNGASAAKPASAPRRQTGREAPQQAPVPAPPVPLPPAPPGTLSNPR
jgi:hypothetical protein